MPKLQAPDLKKYLEKQLRVKLNGNRVVQGVLRGFDPFMNITLEECHRVVKDQVEPESFGLVLIRGSSIEMVECLDRI